MPAREPEHIAIMLLDTFWRDRLLRIARSRADERSIGTAGLAPAAQIGEQGSGIAPDVARRASSRTFILERGISHVAP